jgi:hypothetical protein
MEDFPYLPSAILLDSGTLPGYTGKVEQKARIYIPETALKIKTENHTPPGDVTLYLDGSCAGIRLTAPYQWLIPADLRGKYVEIKLVYSSGTASLYLDGKLMKSRPYSGKFISGTLENNSKTPVRATIVRVSGDSQKCSDQKTASPWQIQGSGLSVKDLGGGKYQLDYDGKGVLR